MSNRRNSFGYEITYENLNEDKIIKSNLCCIPINYLFKYIYYCIFN